MSKREDTLTLALQAKANELNEMIAATYAEGALTVGVEIMRDSDNPGVPEIVIYVRDTGRFEQARAMADAPVRERRTIRVAAG